MPITFPLTVMVPMVAVVIAKLLVVLVCDVTFPVIVKFPLPVLFKKILLLAPPFDIMGHVRLRLQLPECRITVIPAIDGGLEKLAKLRETVPLVADTVMRLVALWERDAEVDVHVAVTPAVLKLNVPPAKTGCKVDGLNSVTIKLVPPFVAVTFNL